MKHFFSIIFAILIFSNSSGQNSSRSTLIINHTKGLTAKNKLHLTDAYHNMNDLKYHSFNLINEQEQSRLAPSRLAKLVKNRAAVIMTYFKENHQVKAENLFLKYGGTYPDLWLHKPKSMLTASGEVTLDENYKQCFDFNPSLDEKIVTASGNTFYFPKNAFTSKEGVNIINKTINICIWEFASKKSLVYAGLTTEANGEMLETGGSFFIMATYNDEKLNLKQGESYTIEIPFKKSHPDMFTYYGNKKDGIINWTVDKNSAVMVNEVNNLADNEIGNANEMLESEIDGYYYEETETEKALDFYEMTAGKLGWINCDRFYEVKEKSPLMVRVNGAEDMVVRLIFRDINSVMPAYANSNHKDQYEASDMPTGEKVLLLAYAVKDENTVFGYKEIVIGENPVEKIDLTDLTKKQFTSAVSELLSY